MSESVPFYKRLTEQQRQHLHGEPVKQSDGEMIAAILRANDAEILAQSQPGDAEKAQEAFSWAKKRVAETQALQAEIARLRGEVMKLHVELHRRDDHPRLLDKDHAEVALWQAIRNIQIGNPTDDKLILKELWDLGFSIATIPSNPNGSEGGATPAEPNPTKTGERQ